MKRETLDGWLEKAILGLALALLVALPLLFGGAPQPATGTWFDNILVEPFIVAEWLTAALVLVWLARLWIDPKPRLLLPPVSWAILAFTAYAIARYWTADIEYVARQEVLRIVVYATLYFVIVTNLHRQESTQVITWTLVALAMALAFYAIFQFLTDSNQVWHLQKPYQHRGTGTYINPNHLGGFLEMILPLAVAFGLMGRLKVLPRIGFGYGAIAILGGIVVTMSRGAWIATALAILFFFGVLLFHRPYRLPAAVAFGVLLVGGLVVLPASDSFKMRLRQIYSGGKLDDDARFSLWRPALQVWGEQPWFGAGPAHFDYRFRAYRPEEVQMRAGHVHNDFLNTLVDFGIVGSALVAVACVLLAAGAVKTWGRVRKTPRDLGGSASSSKTAIVLGAATGLTAIFLHSAVDFNLHVPANAVIAVTLIALLASHIRFATDNYWFTAGPVRRVIASVLLLAVLGGLTTQAWTRTRESVWLARAQRVPEHEPERVALLKRAFEADPSNAETAFAIGEALRFRSSQGTDEYAELANEAISWFVRAEKLNPWDGDAPLMHGWCLDWLGRSQESAPFYDRAELLNPNSYFTMAHIGLHYVTLGNLAAAKPWFERSLRLEKQKNPIARNYLSLVNSRLQEAASEPPNVTPASKTQEQDEVRN